MVTVNLIALIFNTVFVSIPEEIFLIVFALILMGKHEYLSFKSANIEKVLSASIIGAIFSLIVKIYIPQVTDYLFFIAIFVMTGVMILIYRIFKMEEILKSLLCMSISFVVFAIFQTSYIPLLMYGTNLSISEMSQPGLYQFLWSLPERAMEYTLLACLLLKKNSFIKFNFIKTVMQNTALKITTIIIALFNISFLAMMIKLVGVDKILFKLPLFMQILSLVLILLFPIVNTFTNLFVAYYIENKNAQKSFIIQEDLKVSISDIKFYLNRGDYERIGDELKYLEQDANELYKNN